MGVKFICDFGEPGLSMVVIIFSLGTMPIMGRSRHWAA